MAGIGDHPEQDQEHEGASPSEQLIEAARRNNTDLLQEVITSFSSPSELALLLNSTKTVLGNYIYHEAALRGNYEIIDMLLDCEGFECDPLSVREGDTPLHSAVRYINTLPLQQRGSNEEPSFGAGLLGMMIEAGGDVRIKNKANLTPYQLTDPSNTEIRELLQNAIDTVMFKGDFIDVEEDEADEGVEHDSASDDDEGVPPPPPKK